MTSQWESWEMFRPIAGKVGKTKGCSTFGSLGQHTLYDLFIKGSPCLATNENSKIILMNDSDSMMVVLA